MCVKGTGCVGANRVEEMVAIGERAGIPRNDHFVMAARIRAAIVADHQSEVLELADEATVCHILLLFAEPRPVS